MNIESLRAKVESIEARKPDPEKDPYGHRAANDEITRLCDQIRQIQAYSPRKVV